MQVGLKDQFASGQSLSRRVRAAGYAAVQLDACRCQRRLGTAANAAADQGVHPQRAQHTCQRAVAVAVAVHHLGGNDLALLHIIELELLCVAEVLEDLSVFIGYRDSHPVFSFAPKAFNCIQYTPCQREEIGPFL